MERKRQEQRKRQPTASPICNAIFRRSALTATTTTAKRRHITEHATLNVETPAIAAVERDVVYQRRVVIPAGTRAIGTVAVLKSHDRVLVNFHTLVFEKGDEVKFTGMALSLDGAAGLKGKVETHKDAAVANTVLRSFVNGTQSALEMSGVSPIASSATQGLTQEAVKELDTQRQEVTQSITIEAETGLRVYIPARLEY